MTTTYQLPSLIVNPATSNGTSFLLLNNEFHNPTTLNGFEIYSANNGIINIQVINKFFETCKVQKIKFKIKKRLFHPIFVEVQIH